MASSVVLANVKGGGSTVGVAPEPFVTQGLRNGVWDEPFLNIPKELGPYAYTTLNVRLSSIKDEPDTVRKFVKGVIRGLKFTQESREEVSLHRPPFLRVSDRSGPPVRSTEMRLLR